MAPFPFQKEEVFMPFSKFWQILNEDRFFSASILVLFILLITGLILGLSLNRQILPDSDTGEVPDSFSISITVILLALFVSGLFILGFVGWTIRRHRDTLPAETVNQLVEVTEIAAKSLSTSLTHLAQGDLSAEVQLQINTTDKPAENSAFAEKLLGNLIQALKSCAFELNNLTDEPCRRICYVGADSFLEGQQCGHVMADLLEGKGDVIIVTGLGSAVNLELRRKGFENIIREHSRIHIRKIYEDHENPDITRRLMIEALKSWPDLKGIYVTQGATPSAVADMVQEAGKTEQIRIVCHDLTDSTMQHVSQGSIHSTLDQNPYAQGYNPVILLFNYLVKSWKPFIPRMLTRMHIVTPQNYKQFWQTGKGIIQSEDALKHLVKLSNEMPEKPLRIAVMCHENSEFWIPVKSGVLDAKEKLSSRNTTVDWIIPGEISDIEEGEAFKKTLQEIIENGYDGIATILPDRCMIPVINEAISRGIPVITFNSEPISLQGLIGAITDQAEKLIRFSENLGDTTAEANSQTEQITEAMNLVSDASIVQNNQVNQTQIVLSTLLDNINQVNGATEEGAKATSNTATAISEGARSMEITLSVVKSVETAVTDAWHKVEELGKNSEKIDMVIDLIQDITSRVNVLALNASIEATQAGQEGQGFMVVANEVRRLARNASTATQEVTQLIGQIQEDIAKIENVMSSGLTQVQKSARQTTESQNALHHIQNLVETDQSRLKSIADAVAEIQTYSYRVEEAMTQVTEVSERNTQSVQNVNQTTQDMIAQLNQVMSLASTLETMAQSELELLSKFNVATKANEHGEENR
jgi:methyl-accepting chemotaxis protein